jgi:membrane protein implicated in regulation of membrane protease activity
MADVTQKFTLNQWFLLLLSTVAVCVAGFRQYQQQGWLEVVALILAWLITLFLILRHRQRATAVLGGELASLHARLRINATELQIDDEIWPLATIKEVEMGAIDQKRAYVYFTLVQQADGLAASKVVRKFLFPYAEYDHIQQQLTDAIPDARWLLP